MRTIKIELRYDDSDQEQVAVLDEAGKQCAKSLLSTAMLLATRRKPQIAMFVGDNFNSTEEVNLADEFAEFGSGVAAE
jgi:hypothetical protein